MRDTFLPFSPPLIGEEEIAEVVATLRSDWITTGPQVKLFEQEFADFIEAPSALALSSCTAALHTALAALGIGIGDAVVTTPMTFCSSVHVIEQVGAKPVLVDVEPDTLNIDPARVAEVVEKRNKGKGEERKSDDSRLASDHRVRAILPVHLYGHPYDVDAILTIAREYHLAVVEDAAHALPARYKGRLIGSKSLSMAPSTPKVLTAFSFYATKNLTTAEGGMLTGASELLDEARIWSLHGMNRDAYKRYSAEGSWYYEVVRPGFKYNMTDIQAAIGRHQLRKLPQFQARRREIVRHYDEAFTQCGEVQTPVGRSEVEHAWHLYVLRLNLEMLTIDRARFIAELQARNIGTSVHFIPIHLHPYYRDRYHYKPDNFPVAYREYQRIVSLPLSLRLSDQEAEEVIDAVRDVLRQFRR
ncbi:MAG: DegT/DnrJ/EryC1/StrS aminotransferase family protein [Candidatus Marsarchaeota archaeon]|nr:DegT/DnrJ/EryC1/StrS aminotransferase family protein [Candidatus Marsarchaeota archaeon]